MSTSGFEVRRLYQALNLDSWRRQNPFSADIEEAHKVLFDPFATRSDCETQLMRWMQRYQTCLFGRVAAAKGYLHIAILSDSELQTRSDEEISAIIKAELQVWKRRSLRPTADFSVPGHGFVLAVISPRLAEAAPDSHLKAFADKIRELWGCPGSEEPVGEIFWEELYLKHPVADRFWKFVFSVDFFGSQGDQRWWHDHRAPGGLLFTANSVGHMRKYRELYEDKPDGQSEWVIQTAMKTIADAADTAWGKATWLRPLAKDGSPIVRGIECPFAQMSGVRGEMASWDWTRYGGFLHSDHSIRPEFFNTSASPSNDVTRQEHLQDFSYLYDLKSKDYLKFMGVEVSAEEVDSALGPIASWISMPRARRATPTKPKIVLRSRPSRSVDQHFAPEPTLSGGVVTPEARARLDELLARSAAWEIPATELEQFENPH